MSYQKCPVCEGSGEVNNPWIPCSSMVCSTCQGARIIDEVTGLPPEAQIPKTVTTTGEKYIIKNSEQ